jgi:GDP-L-fucose synthase
MREFMFSDDMAAACVFLMNLPDARFDPLLGNENVDSDSFDPPVINVGVGHDISIRELAQTVARVVGYRGDIVYDTSKPDGTPRKRLDVSRLHALGFQAQTLLEDGLHLALATSGLVASAPAHAP